MKCALDFLFLHLLGARVLPCHIDERAHDDVHDHDGRNGRVDVAVVLRHAKVVLKGVESFRSLLYVRTKIFYITFEDVGAAEKVGHDGPENH